MKLQELITEDDVKYTSGGYPTKHVKDKTKLASRLLRRKADRNNPEDGEVSGPRPHVDASVGETGGPI